MDQEKKEWLENLKVPRLIEYLAAAIANGGRYDPTDGGIIWFTVSEIEQELRRKKADLSALGIPGYAPKKSKKST